MNEEMRALEKNQTWGVVYLREGKKPVGNRYLLLNIRQMRLWRDIRLDWSKSIYSDLWNGKPGIFFSCGKNEYSSGFDIFGC